MSYQSEFTGAQIDAAIKKANDIMVEKTSMLPLESGGTGVASLDDLKSILGISSGTAGLFKMVDATTGLKYTWGVNDGIVYIEEVE